MKIVGDKAANNYAALYPYIGKKVQVTGVITALNRYALGLPRELTIEKITCQVVVDIMS